ncbi:MAG: hypothetical protein ACJ0Q6_08420 [Candidatus Azotimanducaceae bacterium]
METHRENVNAMIAGAIKLDTLKPKITSIPLEKSVPKAHAHQYQIPLSSHLFGAAENQGILGGGGYDRLHLTSLDYRKKSGNV